MVKGLVLNISSIFQILTTKKPFGARFEYKMLYYFGLPLKN